MRSAFPGLSFAALVLGGANARAAEPSVEYSVEYAAPAGCPDVETFVRAVTLRVPHARAVPSAAPKIRFRVEQPSSPGDGAAFTFTVLVEGEGSSTRKVPAAPCDDAIASMAVIAALVLESQKLEAADAPASTAASPTAPPPPPPEGRPSTPTPPPPPSESPAIPLELRAAAGAAVVGAAAPVPAFGAWAGADLRWGDTWQGSARLSALYVPPVTESTSAGDAEFRLVLGRASACPVSVAVSALRVFPCVHLEAGSLSAEGVRALNERERSMLWLSAGASVRPELSLLPFLSLEAEAAVFGLLRHDRFTFDPGVTAHDVPPVSYRFGLGLSVALWDTGPGTP